MHFVHLASQYKSSILSITLSLICVPFSLGLICKCWILLMKTYRVLNRLSKCANMRSRKNQVFLWPYQWFTIKIKKIQHTILKAITNKNLLRILTRFIVGKYVYLKCMYITLKRIGKILFVSALRILLICKFLNFTAIFTKQRLNFPKYQLSVIVKKFVFFSMLNINTFTMDIIL